MPFRLEAPSCFYLHALVILLKSLRVAVPGDGIRFSGTPARSAPIKPNIMGTKLQHKSPRPSPNPNCTPNPNYIRPRTHMRQNLARKCMNLINKSRILLAADLFAVVPFFPFTTTKELSPATLMSWLIRMFSTRLPPRSWLVAVAKSGMLCGRRIFPLLLGHFPTWLLPLFNMAQIMLVGNL